MTWVVDTCILIDILDADPTHGKQSAACLTQILPDGLALSPVSYIELAPTFHGEAEQLHVFLQGIGARVLGWHQDNNEAAFAAWHRYVQAKRAGQVRRRPIADILIGASAVAQQGLITRNPRDFSRWFPDLQLVVPG
ncbi:MAG: type II toxin-antitoxin system VapC family toxin [Polyangiales bacterium]